MKISPPVIMAGIVFGACWVIAPMTAFWGFPGAVAGLLLMGAFLHYGIKKL